jgi:hypothetical protein
MELGTPPQAIAPVLGFSAPTDLDRPLVLGAPTDEGSSLMQGRVYHANESSTYEKGGELSFATNSTRNGTTQERQASLGSDVMALNGISKKQEFGMSPLRAR